MAFEDERETGTKGDGDDENNDGGERDGGEVENTVVFVLLRDWGMDIGEETAMGMLEVGVPSRGFIVGGLGTVVTRAKGSSDNGNAAGWIGGGLDIEVFLTTPGFSGTGRLADCTVAVVILLLDSAIDASSSP